MKTVFEQQSLSSFQTNGYFRLVIATDVKRSGVRLESVLLDDQFMVADRQSNIVPRRFEVDFRTVDFHPNVRRRHFQLQCSLVSPEYQQYA